MQTETENCVSFVNEKQEPHRRTSEKIKVVRGGKCASTVRIFFPAFRLFFRSHSPFRLISFSIFLQLSCSCSIRFGLCWLSASWIFSFYVDRLTVLIWAFSASEAFYARVCNEKQRRQPKSCDLYFAFMNLYFRMFAPLPYCLIYICTIMIARATSHGGAPSH